MKLTITGANSYTGPWSSITDFEIICAGTTANKSILGNSNSSKITAYPNPFSDSVTIDTNSIDQEIGSIQLTNLLGETIVSSSGKSTNKEVFNNLSDLSSGLYLLHVLNTDNQILKTIKIVKE